MRKVLVVEDSPSARAFVRAVLEDSQFVASYGPCEVVEATGGFEAMRLLPRGPYDLVVTDVNMADINGLELVQFIRRSEHHKGTPLVLISTQAMERDVARGLSLGADAYLAKPFTAAQLRQTCGPLLGTHHHAPRAPEG